MKFSDFNQIQSDKLLVNSDFFISLSKFKGKIQTFSLYNMRFVAVVTAEGDSIQIYSVYEKDEEVFNLNDDLRRPVLPEMELKELIAEFPSNFKGQVRHITGSIPPQFCNKKLHKLQLLITYANYFVELLDIFPSDVKVASY